MKSLKWVARRWGLLAVLIVAVAAVAAVVVVVMRGRQCDQEAAPIHSPKPLTTRETPSYAKYLKGVKICLDPGHGGRADRKGYKRGPTGLREAEVNLRVAFYLRDFLTASGARVFLTRTDDSYLHKDDARDLQLRAEVANRNACDVFLSIHHNASGREAANFSSVWYHGEVDHSPASLDIARYLSTALLDELPLSEQLGCPLLSDEQMYPKSGFAVLRHAKVPAVLTEASFYTHPDEERRLADPEHNRREARALYLGLARYAAHGIPRAKVVEPADGAVSLRSSRRVVIHLDDGITTRGSWGHDRRLILADSITVRWQGRDLLFDLDETNDQVTVELPADVPAGPMTLAVQFENLFKHSNTRPRLQLRIKNWNE